MMIFRTSFRNSLLLLMLALVSFSVQARQYEIESKSASEPVEFGMAILSDSMGIPQLLALNTGKDNYRFELDSLRIANSQYVVLRNAQDKAEILSIMNCSEAELDAKFPPVLSGLVSLLDSIVTLPGAEVKLRVVPQKSSETSSAWMYALIALIVGFALGYVLFGQRKKKQNALKIDESLAASTTAYPWINDLISRMNVPVSTGATEEELGQTVLASYEDLAIRTEKLQQELDKYEEIMRRDGSYLSHVDEIYSESLQRYFADNKFATDMEPQRRILEAFLPMAIHFQSFIRIKQTKAMNYDKQNYQNILDGGGELDRVEAYPYETDFMSNSPFVASLIAIMKHYDIDALPEVIVYDKRVSR